MRDITENPGRRPCLVAEQNILVKTSITKRNKRGEIMSPGEAL